MVYRLICKRNWQNLILFVASILFSLVIAEGVVRVCIYCNFGNYPRNDLKVRLHQYADNPELLYDLKPSAYARYESIYYKTNKYGMRDYEYALAKPAGVLRIGILGDSISFGFDLPAVEETFGKLLETMLNKERKGFERYEVLNFSVIGYNSSQEEITLKEKALRFSPDIMLVAFCLNDDTYTDGDNYLVRALSPRSFGSKVHSKLFSYISYVYEGIMFGMCKDKNQIEHLFSELSILGKKNNFEAVILVFPYYFRNIDMYDKKMHIYVHDIAQKYGLRTIDFMDSWKSMDWKDRKALYLPHHTTHLSFTGMKKVADELFEYLVNNLIK